MPRGHTRIADQDDLPELLYTDNEAVTEDSALGFPWHENLDALAASAKLCPLCAIVQKGAESWINLYDDAWKNNPIFVEFNGKSSSRPTGQRLWLTKRVGGAPGFLVLVRNPKKKKGVMLLSGVSFACEAGMR
jgi:hypothetical protein